MLKKNYTKTGKSCRVTFKFAPEIEAEEAAVLGEFNGWDQGANKMKKLKDGTFSATLSLEPGDEYRFRYLVDGQTWANDDDADKLVPNRFGGQDCIITV